MDATKKTCYCRLKEKVGKTGFYSGGLATYGGGEQMLPSFLMCVHSLTLEE